MPRVVFRCRTEQEFLAIAKIFWAYKLEVIQGFGGLLRFLDITKQFDDKNFRITLASAINIEGGNAAVTTELKEHCDECFELFGVQQEACEDCGRGPANYLSLPAGDGDGVYPVFEINDPRAPWEKLGLLALFSSQFNFPALVDEAESTSSLDISLNELDFLQDSYIIKVADFEPSQRLWIGNAEVATNTNNAIADVDFSDEEGRKVYVIAKKVPQDRESVSSSYQLLFGVTKESADEMVDVQVQVFESMNEASDPKTPFPLWVIQGVFVTSMRVETDLDVFPISVDIDWDLMDSQLICAYQNSHTEPQHVKATKHSSEIQKLLLKTNYGFAPPREKKAAVLSKWSWALQAATQGDYQPMRVVVENGEDLSMEEVRMALRVRGQTEPSQDETFVEKMHELSKAIRKVKGEPIESQDSSTDYESSSASGVEAEPSLREKCKEMSDFFLPVFEDYWMEGGKRFDGDTVEFCMYTDNLAFQLAFLVEHGLVDANGVTQAGVKDINETYDLMVEGIQEGLGDQ